MDNLAHDYLRYYDIQENDILLDLGASLGGFAFEREQEIRDKNAQLFCVEPSMWSIIRLSDWIERELPCNATLISTAAWGNDGLMDLMVTTCHQVNSLVEQEQDISVWGVEPVRISKVMALSLDTILNIIGKPVNFLACDIEGAEIEVFTACKNLEQIKNMAVCAYHIRDDKPTVETIEPLLKARGFKTIVDDSAIVFARRDE